MCVIAIVREKRPSADIVRAMFNTNAAGAGVAWREIQGHGKNAKKVVCWKKGIDDVEEIIKLSETLPTPYVLHFRIPTCGGTVKALTHPFGVDENASVALEGVTDGPVLFHNGHFNKWKESVRELAIAGAYKIPGGAWSDSRAMAWITYHLGPGMIEFFDEKLVLFGPETIQIGNSNSFTREDEIVYSNMMWRSRMPFRSPYTTPPASMGGSKQIGPPQDDKEDHTSSTGLESVDTGSGTVGSLAERGGPAKVVPFRSAKGGSPKTKLPLKFRNPETGEPLSKKAFKRWKKVTEGKASRGDKIADQWLTMVEKLPHVSLNPAWFEAQGLMQPPSFGTTMN